LVALTAPRRSRSWGGSNAALVGLQTVGFLTVGLRATSPRSLSSPRPRPLARPFLVCQASQQVSDAIEASPLFVHRFDHPPGRLWDVRALEHDLLRLGVGLPPAPRFKVHRREFP